MSLQTLLTLPSFLSTATTTTLKPHRPLLRLRPPSSSTDDPPEAPEDTSHGVPKFTQIQRQASRSRHLQHQDFLNNRSVYLDAIKDVHDAPDTPPHQYTHGDDFFGDIDNAIALKRKEFVKQGLLPPNPPKEDVDDVDMEDELDDDEVVDLDEIDQLRGLRLVVDDDNIIHDDDGFEVGFDGLSDKSNGVRIVEPSFKMTLAELLDECRLVPVSVYGDLEVVISGIEHDSRFVKEGDLYVCCEKEGDNWGLCLSEADKRGAVAVVADKEVDIEEMMMGCKALVIVKDSSVALSGLAASFFKCPSQNLSVIGVTGTHGRTTCVFLIKSMYEAMGLRTGMMSSVGYFVHGDNKLEYPEKDPDVVLVQKLMAKMVCNGTEAVVVEASCSELAEGKCEEVDFDIAVFTNLERDGSGFEGSEEEYRVSQARLFSRMVDPDRHRKIVNIDDVNAPFFIAQGNPDVPVLTFAVDNEEADVRPIKFELSLFETTVLVNTPQGILEISSGLLGRHNVYNILAAVAVGIAVGAPLEDIVRGIEEVDAVPGRCELIDEEQAFGVIVDHARTPDGLARLLDSVRELKPRRIITVVGSCGEKERGKRPLLTKIATDKSDVTMLTSDNPGAEDPLDILDDMLAGIGWSMQDYLKYGENDYYPPLPNGHRIFLHDIRRVAVRCAVAMGEEGDMVVVAGKGHEAYQIEGDKKEFFDDREECREALQYVDELHQAGIDTSEFPWRLPESH